LRDKAIILEVAAKTKDWDRADVLYQDILKQISTKSWYSTQTLDYALLAVGKYIRITGLETPVERPLITGYITLPGQKTYPSKP
jgi:hypothetical protein